VQSTGYANLKGRKSDSESGAQRTAGRRSGQAVHCSGGQLACAGYGRYQKQDHSGLGAAERRGKTQGKLKCSEERESTQAASGSGGASTGTDDKERRGGCGNAAYSLATGTGVQAHGSASSGSRGA
jgi:hypothetical protein